MYDDISIRLLKICDSSTVRPLSIISQNYLQCGSFPNDWKKSNFVTIHKKENKQRLQNSRLVYLLPICSKIFESCFQPYLFITGKNSLLCPNESGFCPLDSSENQLL